MYTEVAPLTVAMMVPVLPLVTVAEIAEMVGAEAVKSLRPSKYVERAFINAVIPGAELLPPGPPPPGPPPPGPRR